MILKKLLACLLALMLVFGLVACSVDQETVDLAADIVVALLEEEPEAVAELPDPEPETNAQKDTPVELPAPEESEPEVSTTEEPEQEDPTADVPAIDEFGVYTTKDDVALYLYTYGKLPGNFMTKNEARKLGWEGGGLDSFADGMCIGGDKFGNYEGILPNAPGRTWKECDIDTLHEKSRGAKRIVFSSDGLIYYTEDHYESFELLYGEA